MFTGILNQFVCCKFMFNVSFPLFPLFKSILCLDSNYCLKYVSCCHRCQILFWCQHDFPTFIYSKAICNYGKNYPLTNTQSYVPLKSGICNCSRNCNIKCIAGCKAITSLKTSVVIAVSSCRLLRCFSLTMNSSSDPFRETSQATPLQHKSLYLCPSGGWYIPNTHISD